MKNRIILFFLFWVHLILFGCSMDSPVSDEEKGDRAFAEQEYRSALQFWIKFAEGVENGRIYHKIGQVYWRLSNTDSAVEYFEKTLQFDPGMSDARKDLIRILLLNGDRDGALEQLGELEKRSGSDADYYLLSGDTLMMSNDFEQARTMYVQAILQDPERVRSKIKAAICMARTGDELGAGNLVASVRNSGNISTQDLMLLADYYLTLQDYAQAESYMNLAVEKNPSDAMIQTDLCRFYLETGKREKAKDVLMKLESLYPENSNFTLMLADVFISEKDMEKAEICFKRAEEKGGNRVELDLLKGKFWLFKGKLPYAVSSLKSAVDTNPGLISGHYLLGIAYFAGGQAKLAENSFIRALLLNPGHVPTLIVLAGLHFTNRDYDLAAQYLERVRLLDPINPRGYILSGLCCLAKNENEKAVSFFSKAWVLGEDPTSLFFLGWSFENQKKVDRALEFYEQALERRPGMPSVLFRYSQILLEQGKGTEALKKINDLFVGVEDRRDQDIVYIAAWISFKLGKMEKAIQYLDQAMKNQEKIPGQFYILLAAVWEKAGDKNRAEQILKECMKINASYKQAWTNLVEFYLRQSLFNPALEVLKQAVEKFPDHPEFAGNLAWIYLETGTELDRALDLARKAYEKLPGEDWLMDTLGWAYYHKKAYTQAEWILAEAEQKAPNKGVLKYHLGMVFYRQSKLFKARETLEAALDGDLPVHDREKIKAVLAEMNPVKKQDVFNTDLILDPEKTMPFTRAPEEENDILVPDWSNIK